MIMMIMSMSFSIKNIFVDTKIFLQEPCMAVLGSRDAQGNLNAYKWHDTSCHNRRAIVCEDLPPHNIQFVRDNNPGVFIP